MPRFTIGIPTYNRAKLLRRAIERAVAQTHPDTEILVSDDGQTEEIPEVVQSFGDRVHSHRNPKNLGMWNNFLLLPKMAEGEYFAWLQDDELIHCDFARRAVEAFESDERIAMYTAYSIDTHSTETLVLPVILGPPVAMDWMNPRVRVMDGSMVLPISFFLTFSMPPITAYRTDLLRGVVDGIDPAHVLFNERIVQSRVVADGKIAVDPWLAGTFYKHEDQGSRLYGSTDLAERSRQWVEMANVISTQLEGRPRDEWSAQLDEWLDSVSPHDLLRIHQELAPAEYWSGLRPLALEVCSRYMERLPEHVRREHKQAMSKQKGPKRIIKDLGRGLMPPLVWDLMKAIKPKSA